MPQAISSARDIILKKKKKKFLDLVKLETAAHKMEKSAFIELQSGRKETKANEKSCSLLPESWCRKPVLVQLGKAGLSQTELHYRAGRPVTSATCLRAPGTFALLLRHRKIARI